MGSDIDSALYQAVTTPPRPFDNPIPASVVEEVGKLQAKVEELTEKCYSAVRMLIDAYARGDRFEKRLEALINDRCGHVDTLNHVRNERDAARDRLNEKEGALAAADRALEVSRECERAAGDALAAAQATIGSQAEELRQSRRALADSETGRLALRAALQKNEPGGNLLKLVELEHRVEIALVVLTDERRAPANRARDGMKALRGEPFTP